MKLPAVAIVGRPNVGKSSLLNRIAGERVSIVEASPGVTRDRVSTVVFHNDVSMELVDTGGIGIIDRDDLADHIETQINTAIRGADVILFLVDVRDGLVPLDREVADRLRSSSELHSRKCSVILVANKVDTAYQETGVVDFFQLGLGEPMAVSARQGFGVSDLLERVTALLPSGRVQPAEPAMHIAVVGRQNVGKSTFVNALAREDRVIVSEVPGTTRDAVDVRFEKDGKTFIIIDTAGLKRRARVKGSVEFYSQARTATAVRRADVVLLMVDASAEISRIDKKLAESVAEKSKPCVIVVNKWDLGGGKVETERYAKYARSRLPGLTWAPLVFTTAKDSRNTQSPIDIAQHLFKKAKLRVGTGKLNRFVEGLKSHHGPARSGGRLPKIFYATQVAIGPPTFVLFVNDPKLFRGDYRRYVESSIRDALGFDEIPLRVFFRQRDSIYKK